MEKINNFEFTRLPRIINTNREEIINITTKSGTKSYTVLGKDFTERKIYKFSAKFEHVKSWSPSEEFYLECSREIIENPAKSTQETCESSVYYKDGTNLFTIDCDRYRNTLIPLFVMHKEDTYVIACTPDGYRMYDMTGKVRADCMDEENDDMSSNLIPCRLAQIDDNTVVLNAWVWHPIEATEHINLESALVTRKLIVY